MFLFRGGAAFAGAGYAGGGLPARTLWEGGSELEGGRLVPPGEREGRTSVGRSVTVDRSQSSHGDYSRDRAGVCGTSPHSSTPAHRVGGGGGVPSSALGARPGLP